MSLARSVVVWFSADEDVESFVRLVLADNSYVNAPLSWFQPNRTARPDFSAPEIIDSGQTLKLGEYEAAVDYIVKAWREE